VPGHGLIALDPNTGDEQWVLGHAASPIIKVGDKLLVNATNSLELVNRDSGTVVTTGKTARPIQHAIAGPNGSVILVTPRGVLLRLNPAQ